MKKHFNRGLFLLVLSSLSLVGCGNSNQKNSFEVTFDTQGGTTIESVVTEGEVAKPLDPIKDGYKFGGWYQDSTLTDPFEFDTEKVTENTTLYAKWSYYSVADLCEMAKDYTTDASKERYYVKGEVIDILNAQFGQMILGDETGQIEVYGTYGADGQTYYPDLEDKPFKGDEVVLYANLKWYNGKPEIYKGWIIEVKHNQTEIDLSKYKAVSVADARKEAKDALVKVTGVVSQFTYNVKRDRTGFILVDGTSSIYVFDNNVAIQVEIGNTVEVAGRRDNWILEDELTSAEKFGYTGCVQITECTLVTNDEKVSDFELTGIEETTVRNIMNTDVREENLTTKVFKVNALIKENPGNGFTNYYINDLDGTTGSYVYTQASGADFEWLREFEGKICTVYLTVLNYKSTASGMVPRFLPVKVIDEGFTFDEANSANFVLDYYIDDLFKVNEFNANPHLQLLTTVSNDIINLTDATVAYTTDNEAYTITTEKKNSFLDITTPIEEASEGTITATVTYKDYTASRSYKLKKLIPDLSDSIDVKTAISRDNEEVTVKGIVGPSLVNKVGFYLIDETGAIAVLTTKDIMATVNIGDEVVLIGKREQQGVSDTAYGQICISNATIAANLYGEHKYSDASFIKDKDLTYLYGLDKLEAHTAQVYVVKGTYTVETSKYSSNGYLNLNDTKFGLYHSSANQYSFLNDYIDQEMTYTVALCNWNGKAHKLAVLNVILEDGTIVNNSLNFTQQ